MEKAAKWPEWTLKYLVACVALGALVGLLAGQAV